MKRTSPCILGLQEIDKTKITLVGGKGANLGELFCIEGIQVPEGFCVTTGAYKRIVEDNREFGRLVDKLMHLKTGEREKISIKSARIREFIESIPIPPDIAEEVTACIAGYGEKHAFAVRSSATAEDLPAASFAGQQDTYLNVIGKEDILKHISKCWASLFTDRAVVYRMQNGFDHHNVQLSVVVQKMVFPQAAGIMFTADPVTGNRKVTSIDAGFGLGEALVSGLVNADNYKVCNGRIIDKKIPVKKLAIHALKTGGTKEEAVEPGRQTRQVLTDEQILELQRIGKRIEEHFGSPQDIEWCLADNTFYIVQSRPVTTLYPIPGPGDEENRVYISVGHQQMMTDAMRPLGLSFYLLLTRAPMYKAGGRLFVDVTPMLATPSGREALINTAGKSDPLIKDALMTLTERGDFIKQSSEDNKAHIPASIRTQTDPAIQDDPSIVSDLIHKCEASLEALKRNIHLKSGTDLFDFILEDMAELKNILFDPLNLNTVMAGMKASAWINEKMHEWLGEKNAADTLAQSVQGNVTSEMGLALLDVADTIRPHPEIMDYLQDAEDKDFMEGLVRFNGGQEAWNAIRDYLDKYGMRCSGEIDITKTRWSEKPAILIPMILSNIKNFEHGEGKRKFSLGLREALKKEQELFERLIQLPGGEQKVKDTKRMISIIRNFSGYREYPKYHFISRYFVYKKALLKEAAQLVEAGVIHEKEDIYYLSFEEFRETVRTKKLDRQVIRKRKDDYKLYDKLSPPRVITSEGEIITGKYRHAHLPAGALAGLAVSSGIVEGRARVILDMQDASLEEGDILVTAFTDPSWTPLFVSIKGLVAEVGGLMTHGSVIAREYGLPAVVGMENATRLIKDGQRIRVNGTDGFVEIL